MFSRFIKFPVHNELKNNDYRNYIAEYLSYDNYNILMYLKNIKLKKKLMSGPR